MRGHVRIWTLVLAATAWMWVQARQPAAAAELNNLHDRAVEQVLGSTRSNNPFIRGNAIEAAQTLPQRLTPLIQLALDDPHPAVRFAALTALGRMKLVDLASTARRSLQDPSQSVQAAALFALRRCGQEVDLTPLAGMLTSQDPGLRGNAAMLLGLLEEPSAAALLKATAKAPLRRANAIQATLVRLQVAEAIVRLGDESALGALRAGMYSQFDEVRVLAVQMVGRLGDRSMEPAMMDLLSRPPVELQLAAAEALARFGRMEGLDKALEAAGQTLPMVQAQAALTLGLFDRPQATQTLSRLLDDGEETVRLAAAAAVLGLPRQQGARTRPTREDAPSR